MTRSLLAKTFTLFLLLGYLTVSAGEGVLHRHTAGEDEQNCAYCHWDHTGAVGTWAPVPAIPAVFIRLVLPAADSIAFLSCQKVAVSARGPPFSSDVLSS
jgi:hypothetical protein